MLELRTYKCCRPHCDIIVSHPDFYSSLFGMRRVRKIEREIKNFESDQGDFILQSRQIYLWDPAFSPARTSQSSWPSIRDSRRLNHHLASILCSLSIRCGSAMISKNKNYQISTYRPNVQPLARHHRLCLCQSRLRTFSIRLRVQNLLLRPRSERVSEGIGSQCSLEEDGVFGYALILIVYLILTLAVFKFYHFTGRLRGPLRKNERRNCHPVGSNVINTIVKIMEE